MSGGGMSAPRRGMVLAAGLGTRLKPITERMPKPLVPVAGRTLIDRALDRFEAAGVELCVVNLHYFPDMLRAHLEGRPRPRLLFSDETGLLLETGGGVRKALPHLGDEPFFVANADVLWRDGPGQPAMARLAEAWDGARMDALLLLQDCARACGYDGRGDFHIDGTGFLRRRSGEEDARHLFAGVQILHPRLFAGGPEGKFSLNVLYDRALAAGRLCGLVHDGQWYHVGTPDGLALANERVGQGEALA